MDMSGQFYPCQKVSYLHFSRHLKFKKKLKKNIIMVSSMQWCGRTQNACTLIIAPLMSNSSPQTFRTFHPFPIGYVHPYYWMYRHLKQYPPVGKINPFSIPTLYGNTLLPTIQWQIIDLLCSYICERLSQFQ